MQRIHSLLLAAFMFAFVVVTLLAPAQPAHAASTTFTFDGSPIGTPAENVSLPGFYLSSPASPNAWKVQSTAGFVGMSGNILKQSNCAAPLVIRLDAYQTTMSLRFGLTNGAQRLRIQGYAGSPSGTVLFQNSYYGTANGVTPGVYEGTISEDVQGMNYIVISAPEGCAAIDNLRFDNGTIVMIPGPIVLNPRPQLPLPQPLPINIGG
jgi:hypothetical protein